MATSAPQPAECPDGYTYEVTLDIMGDPLALLQTNDETFNYRSGEAWLEAPDPGPDADEDDESPFYDRPVKFLRPELVEEFVTLWDRLGGRIPRTAAQPYFDLDAMELLNQLANAGAVEASAPQSSEPGGDSSAAIIEQPADERRRKAEALQAVREAVGLLASGLKSEDDDEYPFVSVDERITSALRMAEEHLTGPSYDFMGNVGLLDENSVSTASTENLAMWFTYIVRGERFSSGHIAAFVDDGTLHKLFVRLLEILGEEGPAEGRAPANRGREPLWYMEDGRKFSYVLMGLPDDDDTVVAFAREEALEDPETGELDETTLDQEFRVDGDWSWKEPADESGNEYDEFWLMYVSREAVQLWDAIGPGGSVSDFGAFLS